MITHVHVYQLLALLVLSAHVTLITESTVFHSMRYALINITDHLAVVSL